MDKIANVFAPASALEMAPVVNYEGAPAYRRDPKEDLLRTLMVGTFEPTFYAEARDLAKAAVDLFSAFAQENPVFLAKAIIYARNQGFMRLAPIAALVELSKAAAFLHREDSRTPFEAAFPHTIRTPGDLQDFLSIIRVSKTRGMGRRVKRLAGNYLRCLSEYHAIKYGSENQKMSLRDMYRLVRPKPTGYYRNAEDALAHYVVKGELADPELLLQVAAFEAFKKATTPAERVNLIAQGRLPHEVVTNGISTLEEWQALMYQMPVFALLRNLVTLNRHGVFVPQSNWEYATRMLTDGARIRKAMILPFRFWSAHQRCKAEGLPEPILSALRRAAELAVSNCPELLGATLVCNDVSGSMSGRVSAKSDMTAAEVAGMLAAAIYKRSGPGSEIVSFDDEAHPRKVHPTWALLDIVQAISECDGGTDLSQPIKYALSTGRKFETLVFITDSEDWCSWLKNRTGAIDAIRQYKQHVNPAARFFFLQVMPYEHAVVPPEEPNCHYVYGWSDEVLRYVGMEAGGVSQVDTVKAIVL